VIATHGRSFYVLDNITPLRQMRPEVVTEDAHLFRPPAVQRNVNQGRIDYYLAKASDKIQVDILDNKGQVVRSFSGPAAQGGRGGRGASGDDEEGSGFPPIEGAPEAGVGGGGGRFGGNPAPPDKAGLNRFTWDLRYPGPKTFEGMIFWGGTRQGPLAVPGTYQVRLTANGKTLSEQFEVEKDPRIDSVTIADLTEQFSLAMKIRDEVTQANEMVILIRALKKQMDDRLKSADAPMKSAMESFREKLSAIEEDVYQVRNRSGQDPLNFPIKLNNKIAALGSHVMFGDGKPTAGSYEVFEVLTKKLNEEQGKLDQVLRVDLPQINKMLTERKLEELTPTKTETTKAL